MIDDRAKAEARRRARRLAGSTSLCENGRTRTALGSLTDGLRFTLTRQNEMPEIATIPTVHDLRRRWKPHKERLAA